MSNQLHASLTRILGSDGLPIGIGFLAADRLILTCAHVVQQAVEDGENVSCDFPLLENKEIYLGKIVLRDDERDIACVEVTGLPRDAAPVLLVQTDELWGHEFRAFGVPLGHDNGVWASGVLRDKNAQDWLHIEDIKTTGFRVQPGFSGGPVWDSTIQAVVGMVVTAERDATIKAAFCIPVSQLTDAYPTLKEQSIPPNPYRGLYAFREQDAPLFFGRDEFSEKLHQAVHDCSLVAIAGASGSGKSSVVFAGLLPKLRLDREWLITKFRPGPKPFESLAAALLPFLESEMSETDRLKEMRKLSGALKNGEIKLNEVVDRIFEKHPDSRQLLLFADQFEELYTLCDDRDSRHHFVDVCLESLNTESGLTFLLTLRADFMGQALGYRPFADALQDSVLNLGPMTSEELIQIITCPAKTQHVEFEEGLPEVIVARVKDHPGALPLLEFTLTQLWECQQRGKLTLSTYQEIGEVEGALAQYADQVYGRLQIGEQEQAERIFIQLVSPGLGTEDTRRLATQNELKTKDWDLIYQLAGQRLVVTDQTPEGEETVEVVHEALIREWGKLRQWMNTHRAFRIWQDRLRVALEQWQESGKDQDALLHGLALREAEEWLKKQEKELRQEEKEFIQESLNVQAVEKKAKARQRRNVFLGAVAAILVIIGTLIYSNIKINAERKRALSNQMAAVSQNYIEEKFDLALLLAAQGAKIDNNFQTSHALLSSVQENLNLEQIFSGHTGYIWSVAFNPDGSRIVSGSSDTTLRLWNADSGQQIGEPLSGHTGTVLSVAFSPDSSRIVSGSDDTTLRLWNADSGQQIGEPLSGHTGSVLSVAFSPDGSRIVSGSEDTTLRLWDADSGQQIGEPLTGHSAEVNSVAFSPDGRRIVSGSKDETIRLWDAATGQQIGEALTGHGYYVTSVAFSPDGSRIVSGSYDTTLRLWDADSGQQIGEPLSGHAGSVLSVAFSPDGSRIVSGSSDNTLRLWDADSGQQIGEPLSGHAGSVWSVAFSPDGSRIVSGSSDTTLRLWDADSGQQIGEPLSGHTGTVWSVAFSPDGSRIVSGSSDTTLRLWDADSGQQIGEPLSGHTGYVGSVAFSPDGLRIVSGSDDTTLRLWNADSGQQIGEPLSGHTGSVLSVAFSPDGSRIVSGSSDTTLRLWDADSGQQIGEPLTGHHSSVNSVAFSPDGSRIVSGSYDTTLRLWDADSGQQIGEPLSGHTDRVRSVAFSPDGSRIVSGSSDTTLRLWDADSGQQIGEPLSGHTGTVWSVAFSPDGSRIVSGSSDTTLRLWDADSGQQIGEPLSGHTGTVWSVAFSPDSSRIVSGSSDTTLRLWDADSGQQIGEPLSGHTGYVLSVAFSPDGSRIVSGSSDNTLRLWDADSGQQIGEPLTGHSAEVNSVAFSPDGSRIVSGSDDTTLRLWDADSGQQIGEPLTGHSAEVNSVAFSPDGRRIVSGSKDETIRLWDAATGQQIGEALTGHGYYVNSVAFSPDGSRIVSGSYDTTLRLWDADSGQQIGGALTGHSGRMNSVNSVAFSPDGSRIVSGGSDTTLRLWDADSGQQIGEPLTGHHSSVNSVAFSPDGSRIVSGSYDTTLRLWDADSGQQIGEPIKLDRKAWPLSLSSSGVHYSGHTGEVYSVAFSPNGKKLVSGSADTTIRLWNMDIQSWQEKSCQRAGRNLTLAEWQSYYSESLPYEPTCPQWPIPDDAQTYLDRRALRQRQIVAGGVGLLAICILIWRRKTRKVEKE